MRYPLAAPDAIPQADLDALADWIRGGPHLTMGSLCRRFEEEFAAWLGRKHAIFCNSGSAANWLMTLALKWIRPDITALRVPAIGWPTTISPALALGYGIEFLDADADTWGIGPTVSGPMAVIGVPVLGVPCAVANGIYLEDACAALGSTSGGRKCGTFGAMASFSFYFSHQISTIEGGMVVTDDALQADILRMLRAHGWAVDLEPEREARWWWRTTIRWDFDRRFTFYVPGMNARPTEIQGFLGLRQMQRIDQMVARRVANDQHYRKNLAGADHLTIQQPAEGDQVCSIAIGVLAASPEHRAKVAYALSQAGIETRPVGGGNLARQPFVNRPWQANKCPMADEIGRRGFQIPNTPQLTSTDTDFISEIVLKVRP